MLIATCLACENASSYTVDLDPPADWDASPYTGWTREHYVAVFGRMCLGYSQHLTEDGGRIDLPNPGGWSPIEGIARMMLAIGPWLSNPANPDVIIVDGTRIDLVELSRKTLVTLSDPRHVERWPRPQPGWSQGNVEAAFVAQFLVLTSERVWPQLTAQEQRQVMNWLVPGDADKEVYGNNWSLFPTMRNVARAKLGYRVDVNATDRYLDTIEAAYAADGWYSDGQDWAFDWYNSFILHPELLFWAMHEGQRDPERAERIIRRARAYLHHIQYMFAANGSAVAFGRSLTYRTAVLAPLPLAIQAGVSPLPPGRARRLLSANLAYHMNGDPSSTNAMINGDDLIGIGYLGSKTNVRDPYISVGSPYFASRILQVLALPPDHEFWTAKEEPLPVDEGPFEHAMPGPGLTSFSLGGDEPVNLWNGGNQKNAPAYSKLNYSTHFPFQIVHVNDTVAYDSALYATPDDETFLGRGRVFDVVTAPGYVFNRSTLDGQAAMVSRAGLDFGDRLVRLACLSPGVGGERGLRLFEGAHPIAVDDLDEEAIAAGELPIVRESGGTELWEYASSSMGSVMIAALFGFDMTIPAHAFRGQDNLNLVHAHALQPALATRYPTTQPQCVASLAIARLAEFDAAQEAASVTATLDEATRSFIVEADAGEIAAWVTLANWADPTEVTLREYVFAGPLRFARVDGEGRRITAVGVVEIRDPQDRVVFSSEAPVSLSLDLERGQVVLDGPGRLWLPGVVAVEGVVVGGETVDRSDEIIESDELVFDEAIVRAHGQEQELVLATFVLEGP
jgi:hypothetical protein